MLQTQRVVHQADLQSRFSLHNPATLTLYNRAVALFVNHGATLTQARALALEQLAGQIAQQAAAWAFQDVYWISATVTIPAIFLPLLLRPQRGTDPTAMVAE